MLGYLFLYIYSFSLPFNNSFNYFTAVVLLALLLNACSYPEERTIVCRTVAKLQIISILPAKRQNIARKKLLSQNFLKNILLMG